jgi:hypothetical protein
MPPQSGSNECQRQTASEQKPNFHHKTVYLRVLHSLFRFVANDGKQLSLNDLYLFTTLISKEADCRHMNVQFTSSALCFQVNELKTSKQSMDKFNIRVEVALLDCTFPQMFACSDGRTFEAARMLLLHKTILLIYLEIYAE